MDTTFVLCPLCGNKTRGNGMTVGESGEGFFLTSEVKQTEM